MIRLFSGLVALFIPIFMAQSVQAESLNELINGRWEYCVVQGWEYDTQSIEGWSIDYKSDCVREYTFLSSVDTSKLTGQGDDGPTLRKIAAEKSIWMPNYGCSHAAAQTTTGTVLGFNLMVETTNYGQDGNVTKTCTTGLSTG